MNINLRELSSIGSAAQVGSDARDGLQRVKDRASRRLAGRRANISAEQETERLWFWKLVKLEVERARRQDNAFSVLCVRNLEVPVIPDLADRVRPHLRDTDAVLAEGDRLSILLGETSGEATKQATHRLANHPDLPTRGAEWQEVAFPRDALTFGALIECLLNPDMGERLLRAG